MDAKALDLLPIPEFTCYQCHIPPSLSTLKFDLKGRQTTEEPVEMFDLQFISTIPSYNIRNICNYVFVLIFYNNLHEISKNYYYEIIVKATQIIDQKIQVRSLLSIAQNRITNKIHAKGTFVDVLNANHYTVYIRRYKDMNRKQEITKGDNIGSMLWSTGAYSDISLIVGEKIFRVHKEVLSQNCEVFKKMFSHEMVESQNGIIKIDDLDVEVVEEMLSYIYTGRAGNIAKMPRELFEVAHRYQLHELQSLCEEHLIFSLNYQNVIGILDIAELYDLEDLRKGIKAFVQNHEEIMALEPSFQSFLCRALKVNNAVDTLLLADRYKLDDIMKNTFKFIKEHDKEMMGRKEFLELFKSHPELIREVFKYIYEIVTDTYSTDSTDSSDWFFFYFENSIFNQNK